MRNWRHALFVLLAVCVLLSACTSKRTTPASATLQEEDNQENGQVLTVVNPEPAKSEDTAAAQEAPKYQIQTRLTDFKLMNDTTGLAWGITRGELRLYTTKDRGLTWTNISPAATVQFPNAVHYGKEMYFLDQSHGWIMRKAQNSAEGILLRTVDGGLHWKISSLPPSTEPSSVYFATADRGWIISLSSSSPGNQKKTLYNTYDGGMTWVPAKDEIVSSGQPGSLASLPQYGYFTDMEFTTEQQGYVLLQELQQPDLYTTYDGGKHWTASSGFFKKQDLGDCDSYTADSIRFFNDSGQSGLIPVRCTKGTTSKFSGYFTADGGKAFSFINFPLPWQSDRNATVAPYFINEQEGWSIQGHVLYHTVDQGKSWTSMPESSRLSEALKEYPEVVKLQFISPEYGWILIQNSEERTSRLLSTKDGGLSWQML